MLDKNGLSWLITDKVLTVLYKSTETTIKITKNIHSNCCNEHAKHSHRLMMDTSDMTPLQSAEGKQLLSDTVIQQILLLRIFSRQFENGYCGVQSAALLMSARHFGGNCPKQELETCDVSKIPYKDTNMFSFSQTTDVLDEERLLKVGATFKQIRDLFQAHNIPVKMYHADDSSLEEFRKLAKEALSATDSSKGVMINYLYICKMKDNEVIELGHFSPLAAYNGNTDRFLILDTWMVGVDVWVTTKELFNRMNTVDADSGLKRGFLIIG